MSELPKGWAEATLGEIAPLTYGKALVGKSRDPEGKIPVFGSSGRIGLHSHSLTNRETLIVGRKGNVGAVYHSAEPCWVIDTAYFVDTVQWFNWRFLFHLLSYKALANLDRSTAIPGLSRDDYNNVTVQIAPVGEQDRIADEIEKQFTRLDVATAALKRVQANLKRYRASVLKAACQGRLVPTEAELARREGRDYEPADKLLQRILRERRARWESDTLAKMQASGKPPGDDRWKQKYKEPAAPDTINLTALPEGWNWISLDSLIYGITAGKSFKCDERPPEDDEHGVVKVSSVTWGVFDELESKTCMAGSPWIEAYRIRPDDFLFSRANTIELVGACVITKSVRRNLMLSDKILRFEVVLPRLKQWLLVVLRSKWGRSEIERLSTGNQESMRNIGQDRIRGIRVPLPPAEEIGRIISGVETNEIGFIQLEKSSAAQVKRSASLRRALLEQAFTGQLVPQDPTDEPASALLERIRAERSKTTVQMTARRSRKDPAHA